MENQYKMNGKKAVSSLRALAIKHQVRLVDAFLLADLHPSNLTRWSKEIHKARVSHVKDVAVSIELLKLRSDLMACLLKSIKKKGCSQKELAGFLGISEDHAGELLEGKASSFSTDKLLAFLGRLDGTVSVKLSPIQKSPVD